MHRHARIFLLAGVASALFGQSAENVLVVVNESSSVSRRIGEYYVHKRQVPLSNLCRIKTGTAEEISRAIYENEIERPIARYLKLHGLDEKILYIATTLGVPLKIKGPGDGMGTESASVDSELTLLYRKLKGEKFGYAGIIPNPLYRKMQAHFGHPQIPIYLVTRLAGYDFEDVQAMIDRSLGASNRGKFIFDLKAGDSTEGNQWLREAAQALPADRVVLDDTAKVLYQEHEVMVTPAGARTTVIVNSACWGSSGCRALSRLNLSLPTAEPLLARRTPGISPHGRIKRIGSQDLRRRSPRTISMKGPAAARGMFTSRTLSPRLIRNTFSRLTTAGEIWRRVTTSRYRR